MRTFFALGRRLKPAVPIADGFSARMFSQKAYANFVPQWQSRAAFDSSFVEIERCDGVYIYDSLGQRQIDMMSQILTVNLGHNLSIYKQAISEQLSSVPFLNTIKFMHPILDEYTRMLAGTLPADLNASFFTVSGAEANEAAIKVARTVTGRSKVLYRSRSYHGASFATMSVSGDPRRGLLGGLVMPGAVEIPHAFDLENVGERGVQSSEMDMGTAQVEAARRVIEREGSENIAAMLIEVMTGGGGMYPPPPGAMAGLKKLCEEHGILFIADEVVTGFGRTGTMWAFEQEGFTPDIMTLAKGITNGIAPLGAVVLADRLVEENFISKPFPHGLTNNAHLLSIAAAKATLEHMANHEYFLPNINTRSHQLRLLLDRLAAAGTIQDYRLRGLLGCIVCNPPRAATNAESGSYAAMLERLRQKGVYTIMRENLLFLAPPFVISEAELGEAMAIIEEVIIESTEPLHL